MSTDSDKMALQLQKVTIGDILSCLGTWVGGGVTDLSRDRHIESQTRRFPRSPEVMVFQTTAITLCNY